MKARILFALTLASFVVAAFGGDSTDSAAYDEQSHSDMGLFQERTIDVVGDVVGDGVEGVEPSKVQRCLDISLFGAMELQAGTDCQVLLKELTVELIASSEQGGVLTYFFHGEPVLRLSYSSGRDSSELDFGGLKSLLDAV